MEDGRWKIYANMDGKFAVRNTTFILIVLIHISQYCTVTGIYQRLKYLTVISWSSEVVLKPR